MGLYERLGQLDDRVLGPRGGGPARRRRRSSLVVAGILLLVALGVGLPVGIRTHHWFWLIESGALSLVVFASTGRRTGG